MWLCMGGEYHRTRVVSNVSCRISPVRILTWPRRFQRPACKHFKLMSYLVWEYLIFWLNPLQHIWSLQPYWMPSGSWKWMPLEKYCSLSKFALQQVDLFKMFSPFSHRWISTLCRNCLKGQIVQDAQLATDDLPRCHGHPMVYHGHVMSCDVMCCMLRWSLGRLGLKTSRNR